MIEVAIVVKDFLILVDGPDGMNNPVSAIVCSGSVRTARMVGQTDAGVHRSPKLNILTVNETVASSDELIDLIGITGAGLDMFGDNGGYPYNFWVC